MQHNSSDGRSSSSSSSVINLNASEMSVIWRWALWSSAHWPRDARLPFPSANPLLLCFCFSFLFSNSPLSLRTVMLEVGGIYLFICVGFLLIKHCCKGPCDEIRQRCLNKGWRVHNCRSYRSEVPGANCQSRANDDKCLSMQIAAAVQAGRRAGGRKGVQQEGEKIVAQSRICSCTFLMACLETRLEVIGRPSSLSAEAVLCHR